jgi:hypothetical protein
MSSTTAEETTTNGTADEASPTPLSSTQKMAVARAARAFSTYGEAKKAMAKIAKAIVNLRLTFEKDGRPDYRGETPQYRGAIASLYEAAITDENERQSFKVAIRYWVGKEFAARVKNGTLIEADLIAAGVMTASTDTPTEPAPRRNGSDVPTGVVVDGTELTPTEVMVEAERIVAEHVTDKSLGVVIAVQSISRTLGPVVAALRDEDTRTHLPGRSLRQGVEQVLNLALDAAKLSDIDVEEFFASWSAAQDEHSALARDPEAVAA